MMFIVEFRLKPLQLRLLYQKNLNYYVIKYSYSITTTLIGSVLW